MFLDCHFRKTFRQSICAKSNMLSKFLRLGCMKAPKCLPVRFYGDMLPRNQYEVDVARRMRVGYALRVYWELWPLFIVTGCALTILLTSTLSACKNKVDVVFSANSRRCISRTMDLRAPTVHKLRTIHQRYEPWPEMQDVLDRLRAAEKRALSRAEQCSPQ